MEKIAPSIEQKIALNAIRNVTFPDNIKVRIKEKAMESLMAFDLDEMLTHLQYIPSSLIVDLVSYSQVNMDMVDNSSDLKQRLSCLYNGNLEEGGLDPTIDHTTAIRSLIEHYNTYRVSDVVSVLADQTSIGIMCSNENMTAIQHNFNLPQLIADDLAANLGSLVQTAGDQASFSVQSNRITSNYAHLIRNLKIALSVAEAANNIANGVIAKTTLGLKAADEYSKSVKQ